MNHHSPHIVVDNISAISRSNRVPDAGVSLSRRLVAEGLGTALLLAVVVGSALMGERLAAGNATLAIMTLLASTLAASAGLLALLLTFGSVSAHFNPVVTLSLAWQRKIAWADVAPYIAMQIAGACGGIALTHAMFGLPLFSLATQVRAGSALLLSEFVATFGLIAVVIGCSRRKPDATPFAVSAYVAAAYWFTASSGFANPALTLARTLSDTVAGISILSAMGYVVAQLLGAMAATILFGWLLPDERK